MFFVEKSFMPKVHTPKLERLLQRSNNDHGIAEYHRLHNVIAVLIAHYLAVKNQSVTTDSAMTALLTELTRQQDPPAPASAFLSAPS